MLIESVVCYQNESIIDIYFENNLFLTCFDMNSLRRLLAVSLAIILLCSLKLDFRRVKVDITFEFSY